MTGTQHDWQAEDKTSLTSELSPCRPAMQEQGVVQLLGHEGTAYTSTTGNSLETSMGQHQWPA